MTTSYLILLQLAFCKNVLYELPRVLPSNLDKSDLVHTVYIGIFKHTMDRIAGCLKKHRRLDAFEQVWKTLLPYIGLLVPKNGYLEVTQWQVEEIGNMVW